MDRAYAALCFMAMGMPGRCTIVLEAQPFGQRMPFDMWLWEWGVLVEVDGEQHTQCSFGSTAVQEQMLMDARKEQAAIGHGLHVVRLHHADWLSWAPLVREVALAARSGVPPAVHRSPAYPTLKVFSAV